MKNKWKHCLEYDWPVSYMGLVKGQVSAKIGAAAEVISSVLLCNGNKLKLKHIDFAEAIKSKRCIRR